MHLVRPAVTALALMLAAAGIGHVRAASADGQHAHERGHMHVRVPPEYAGAHIPVRVWTDAAMIARGKEIYTAKCAECHGARGEGDGPDAASLSVKPANLADGRMVAEMPGSYWFWRVSEGAEVEPFEAKGSKMPAWKDELSVSDRWAVIAYAHTLSGHAGPHTPREHPEMGAGHGHGAGGHGR